MTTLESGLLGPLLGASVPIGSFRLDLRSGRWAQDAVLGERFTDELLTEPTDSEVEEVRAALRERRTFAAHRPACRVDGRQADVVVIGSGDYDDDEPVAVSGWVVDVTTVLEDCVNRQMASALDEMVENRAQIEQAKGLLMGAYGLGADAAFAMLRWWSSDRNVKIRDLAGRVLAFASTGGLSRPEGRAEMDAVLDRSSTA